MENVEKTEVTETPETAASATETPAQAPAPQKPAEERFACTMKTNEFTCPNTGTMREMRVLDRKQTGGWNKPMKIVCKSCAHIERTQRGIKVFALTYALQKERELKEKTEKTRTDNAARVNAIKAALVQDVRPVRPDRRENHEKRFDTNREGQRNQRPRRESRPPRQVRSEPKTNFQKGES